MTSLFVGIHLKDKSHETLPMENIDFGKSVFNLKQEIAKKFHQDVEKLELIYQGCVLNDDDKLEGLIRPHSTVHCFLKTKKYVPYEPTLDTNSVAVARVQQLFNVIAHIQISVSSRVNILHKILAEYPEFRRNLGAQALIRDSVLFNTLHLPDVIKNVAEHYPIICEAAPFIVDTIKKELIRGSAASSMLENTNDSTNSSEEESSFGGGSSETRGGGEVSANMSETENIRRISRQQLQSALRGIGLGSVNSLSNIAQRNTDASSSPALLTTSASGERISSELFRSGLQRALSALTQRANEANTMQPMETQEPPSADNSMGMQQESTSDGDIPAQYRNHQYAEQLRTMAQMGFVNYEENLTYLNITNGSIENAVNLVMGSMN